MKKFLTSPLLGFIIGLSYSPFALAAILTGSTTYKDKNRYTIIRSLPPSYQINVETDTVTFDELSVAVSKQLEIPRDKFELKIAEDRFSDYSGHLLSDLSLEEFRDVMKEMASDTFSRSLTL